MPISRRPRNEASFQGVWAALLVFRWRATAVDQALSGNMGRDTILDELR